MVSTAWVNNDRTQFTGCKTPALDNSTLTTELRGGSGHHEGNVYLNNLPVCHDWWGDTDAAVVCRMLGYVLNCLFIN